MRRAIAFVVLVFLLPNVAHSQNDACIRPSDTSLTNDFYFTATSEQGARGDIVGIDVGLVLEREHRGILNPLFVCCYDPLVVELVAEPEYTPLFDQLAFSSFFQEEGATSSVHGFVQSAILPAGRWESYFPNTEPVHLFTVYFRLIGDPGSLSPFEFCDAALDTRVCRDNYIGFLPLRDDPEAGPIIYGRSTRHVSGEIRIVDGEPTRTELPDLPPLARIYPEPPTPESADIHFELEGTVAQPGSAGVPMDVYITSNYEFSGFYLSVAFPPEYLSLARVAEHTRPGILISDHEIGHVVLAMLNSRRRAGAEGERVRVATLYFDLEPAAAEVNEITPRIQTFGRPDGIQYNNGVIIHHLGGPTADLPVTSEVTPIAIANGLLRVQREATVLGDVNLDYALDLSDAVALLDHLFRNVRDLVCPSAADFNEDASVNLSDAVSIVNHLFLGGAGPAPSEVFCDG